MLMQLPYGDSECFVWYVALAHYLACVNLELVSLFRSCLLQQAASWARGVCVAVASSQCSACSARSGCKFITLTFGHSCELESLKLKAGPWCLDLRRLGRMAAESEPRARGEGGFVSNLVRRGLPRRMALAVVAVLGFQVSQIVPQACPSR